MAVGGVLALVAAGIAAVAQASQSDGSHPTAVAPTALQDEFASAAREFRVPQSVLMAVAYQESRWDTHAGRPSMTGNYNVMGLTQVTSTEVHKPSVSERTRELNLRGEGRPGSFHPSKHVLADVGAVRTGVLALHTLDQAAKLIGAPATSLRSDMSQSVRGGAALLAEYERAATGGLPADPARWYAAVERYSQSPDSRGAAQLAQRVYTHIRSGISRVTADGQQVTLNPRAGLKPQTSTAAYSTTGSTHTGYATATDANYTNATTATATSTPAPECPSGLACNFVPAAYQQTSSTDTTQYGNYDVADRPSDGDAIKYIVIHDTESDYASGVGQFQDPTAGASAHYVIRSSDGLVTQMVPNADVAWYAGNWYMNQHAVGIEHEGYALQGASWYTESEYESSAALVKYLAGKYGIPLDREHIIGHDDVTGPLDAYVSGMHWDPGTYWDWNHYMSLLGAPANSNPAGSPLVTGEIVRIAPPFTTSYEPPVNGQSAQPANFAYLRTSPSSSASLITNPYFSSGSTDASDWSDKAIAGEDFVVAAQQDDWTAIWYDGMEAWFDNPHGSYTVPVSDASAFTVVTARDGVDSIPVYGRAYPEASAYPSDLTPQPVTPLTKYSIPSGQSYVAIAKETSDYYRSTTYDGSAPHDRTVITGTTTYYPIRYNHRLAYLSSADVKVVSAVPGPAASTRQDLIARDTSGNLWQYQGTGVASSPFLSRYEIGYGWGGYNAMTPMSVFHADGTGDMVTRDGSGNLWYYQGSANPSAPFKARVKAGYGWGGYTMLGMGDLTGDGKPDLLARDSSGNLYVYPGTGSTTSPFGPRIKAGYGWGAYTMVNCGDLTADGKPDLLARDSSGNLYVYPGTGSTTSPFGPRTKVGSGWGGYTLVGPGDVNGDGKPDLVARDSSGNVYLYPGTGSTTSPYGSRSSIGTGWDIYNTIV
ncbi:N-acetylmuramoyl-L-alanine amidase [Streptomyces sp. NPDC004393]